MNTFQGLSFIIYQIICFILLIRGFKSSTVTAGDFILLLSINIAIIDILWSISADIIMFSEYISNISQGLKIILSPIIIQDKINAKLLEVTNGEIIFDKVKFHYKNTTPLFEDKSITIAAKQKIGLVGYSGSGKTTFANLILRFYEISEGRILIDGQNISHCTQDSLRDSISMIAQDPSLFHRSLLENISYGKHGATEEEIIMAAKHAHAHEFIMDLPDGYYSLVGERGVKLSGGQRQRIAVARAILKDAPILILDEATSQLDSITESYIQESLLELMENKTTIVIAHRLSTLLHMDRILVFDKGKIIEDGTHEELLALKGLYSMLWNTQIGGFIPDKRL
jgi:ATP-binding cassette subfamily B protein